MRIPFLKSREEIRLERRARVRARVRGFESYIRKMEQVRSRFRGFLARAVELENHDAVRQYAGACASFGKRIERAQKQLLAIEALDAVTDMVEVDREFVEFARDMGRTMSDTVGKVDLVRFQADLERGLLRAEQLDDVLGEVLDQVGDSLVGTGVSDEELAAAVRESAQRATAPERDADLEARIARELAEVRKLAGRE